jgi:hypothetical protein
MYNNTQEKVIQLELFNVSDIPLVPIPKKKPHNHDRKFENYLTRFVIRSKKGKK